MTVTAPTSTYRREDDRPRSVRMRGPVATAAAMVLGTVALHLRDPHQSGSWGFCPFKLLTGLDCPGCGSLRAVNDLTRADLLSAASSNLLFVVLIPLLLVMTVLWLRRAWRGERWVPGPRTALWTMLALAVTVGFTVLRNLPAGSWLAS